MKLLKMIMENRDRKISVLPDLFGPRRVLNST